MAGSAEDAILLPLERGDVSLPGQDDSALYAGARIAAGLKPAAQHGRWQYVQHFKPWAEALAQNGFDVSSGWPSGSEHALALVLAARQREETQGLLARAALSLREGGWLICAGANDAGGKRLA